MQRGQAVILAIVCVAVAMASYACWHHYRKGRKALRFWGSESAELIRHAEKVRLLKLDPGSAPLPSNTSANGKIRIGNQDLSVVREVDISSMRGLVHARHTLIEDRNFKWNSSPTHPPDRSRWDFALEFSNQEHQLMLVFDVQHHVVRDLGTGRQKVMVTEIMEGIHKILKLGLAEMTPAD